MLNKLTLIYLAVIAAALIILFLGIKKRWLYTFLIGATFLIPGILKALDAHFNIDIPGRCKALCDLSPIELTFYYFSYSRLFIRSLGLLQAFSGILVFIPRYRFVGLLCCLSNSVFINLLNLSFWGMSVVTIYMVMITFMVLIYLRLDYMGKVKSMIS